MAKQIAKLLKADLQESSDLRSIARMLSSKGRGNDTMLAHITPREMKILKAAGGSGTVNPETGLMEFDDTLGSGDYTPAPSEMNVASQQFTPIEAFGGTQAGGDAGYTFTTPPAEVGASMAGQPAFDPYAKPVAADTGYAAAPVGTVDMTQQGVAGVPAAAPGVAPIEERGVSAVPIEERSAAAAPAAEKSALQRYVGDPLKSLKEATGLSATDLLRIGGAGVGALTGRAQSQQAAKQIQQAVQEQKDIGQPYQKAGTELQRAAMAGELTPQSMQAYQALQAQLAQGAASRGGVGIAQSQAQLEAFRQNLLQNQYNYGLQVSQIGDNIALGAIKTGMQLDQQLAQANQAFYTQLAAIAGGGTYGYQAPKTAGGQ